MKRFLLCLMLLSLGFALPVRAQMEEKEQEKIEPDRRDFTTGTGIAPSFQLEVGATAERRGDSREYSLGETTMRLPVSKRVEARFQFPSYRIERDSAKRSGADDSMLEARFLLIKKEKTEFALQLFSVLPTGSRRVAERRYQPGAILASTLKLSPSTNLVLNLGAKRASEEQKRFSQVFVASSLRFDVSKQWNVFTELYAFNREEADGPSQKFASLGAVYYLNRRTALDARFGVGLGNDRGGPDYLYSAGLSRLF